MPEVFDALPGQEVPVGGIDAGFTRLWADTPAKESRAVQLNLVLHFGRNSTPEDALEQFEHTRRFAQRYPCRVVVLCPDHEAAAPAAIRAKIYGECFLGKSPGDTRCVEFVLLHYTLAARSYLESQVSVCLSTDMPLYYWAHRFADVQKLADYHYLLGWVKKGLTRSGADTGTIAFEVTPVECPGCFSMKFTYADPKKIFSWEADLSQDHADFTGDLGTGRTTLVAGAHFLAPELTLSEAMFF